MIKKIIRKNNKTYEVMGEAKADTQFKKGKAYILGDKVYLYWGDVSYEEHARRTTAGFYHCKEASEHIIFNHQSYGVYGDDFVFEVSDIEDVNVDRLNETITLFEQELYKYLDIKNTLSDNREELFKVTGSIDSVEILSAISAMMRGSSDNENNIIADTLNIKFNPKLTEGVKITRNGKTPKMEMDKHDEKIISGIRFQFYEYK